ncbi:hypothetical protein DKX38_016782 [Salix brachista]|uniref:TF-B3 domain-containing protein n=1 Tax=Salix brachista TaxID=2182728 RepID=A0A5N5KUL9_9ROSI|nr:hypothetical protein DKX38_016782 [Salix brachista]
MEVMNKILSGSDATNRRLEFPAGSLWAFPMPDGQNSVEFVASDIHEQQWRLKVSVRNEGRYSKPWLKGEWGDYVHQKQLRKGDRVILTMNDEENGERSYRIGAERKHFGFWYSIDEQQDSAFSSSASTKVNNRGREWCDSPENMFIQNILLAISLWAIFSELGMEAFRFIHYWADDIQFMKDLHGL